MTYRDITRAQLTIDEGRKRQIYVDTVGKITGGVGRNLTDRGFSDDEIDLMLDNDLAQAEKDARLLVRNFDQLSDNRKAVVLNMSFQLGFQRFSKFTNTLKAINAGEWDKAADGLLDSLSAKQCQNRYKRLSKMMVSG